MICRSIETSFSQNRLIEESNSRSNQTINSTGDSEHPKARRRQGLPKCETGSRIAILNNLAIVLEQTRFRRFPHEKHGKRSKTKQQCKTDRPPRSAPTISNHHGSDQRKG